MVRDALIQLISKAIDELVEKQVIDPSIKSIPIEIEPPKQTDHGDFATNFCLVASKTARTNPRALAETLLPAILQISNSVRPPLPSGEGLREGHLEGNHPALPGEEGHESGPNPQETSDQEIPPPSLGRGWGGVEQFSEHPILSAEIAEPGFINFKLNPAWAAQFLTEVLQNPSDFYKPKNDNPQKINVEFVSVNPNGPITIGSGRGAAFGSALCNILEAAGNTVHREYYINDGVNSEQMRLFAESVKAIIEGRPIPDNGYKGDYVQNVALDLSTFLNVENSQQRQFSEIFENFVDKFVDSTDLTKAPEMHIAAEKLKGFSKSMSKNNAIQSEYVEMELIRFLAELKMIRSQSDDLRSFEVNFDTWFSEQSLHDSGVVEQELHHLLATQVADDEPTRTKVVFAKGGQIKEVIHESQSGNDETSDAPDRLPREGGDPVLADTGSLDSSSRVDQENPGGNGETTESEIPSSSLGRGRGGVDDQNPSNTIWLRSTKFGDDQDRVLKRADGRLTYIASDVAYHKDKFNRPANADKLITVLGPDHHGYIARLTAVVAAMFSDQVAPLDNPEPLSEHEALIYSSVQERNQCQAALAWAKDHLEVQIFQIVRFLKDGKPAPMRKRDGNIYALIDLINEIGQTLKPDGTTEEKQQAGSDVARFFYLMRHHDTAMDFDLELATKQSDENPVFYVQYAHARICSVIDKATASLPLSASVERGLGGEENQNSLTIEIERGPGAAAQSSGSMGDAESSLPGGEGKGRGSTTYNAAVEPITSESTLPNGVRDVALHLLQHPKELALILKICDLQNEVARTAEDYSVNRLTTYAIELARTYHSFYDSCRVIQPDQPELSQARLALCEATRTALRAALELLGVSAPNRMDRAERPA